MHPECQCPHFDRGTTCTGRRAPLKPSVHLSVATPAMQKTASSAKSAAMSDHHPLWTYCWTRAAGPQASPRVQVRVQLDGKINSIETHFCGVQLNFLIHSRSFNSILFEPIQNPFQVMPDEPFLGYPFRAWLPRFSKMQLRFPKLKMQTDFVSPKPTRLSDPPSFCRETRHCAGNPSGRSMAGNSVQQEEQSVVGVYKHH